MRDACPRTGELPREGGAYALVLRLRRAARLRVGRLGDLRFAPGWYVYVGSARGGLRARVARHLRGGAKRRHWHVDHLREHALPVAVALWPGPTADECVLARAVAGAAAGRVEGFGSSDCSCASHLYHFRHRPGPVLKPLLPKGAVWRRLVGGNGG